MKTKDQSVVTPGGPARPGDPDTASPRGDDAVAIAERVRAAVVRAGLAAFEDAGMQGLCCEGAWELAVSAMRGVDLRAALAPPKA